MPARNFVIFTLPRTGSTLLTEMLDSHPSILCHTEIFNPKSTYLSRKPHLKIGSKSERDQRPHYFLRRMFEAKDGADIVGFKIMPFHQNRIMTQVLLSRKVKKVILTRRNWLQAFVSNQIAFVTNQYLKTPDPVHKPDGQDQKPMIEVQIPEFRRYHLKVRIYYGVLRVLQKLTFQDFFWIDYQDLKNEERLRELLGFLSVSTDATLEERLEKQNKKGLAEKVSNFEEIKTEFRGTKWEFLLESDK